MIINNSFNRTSSPSFGKFIKIKGDNSSIDIFRKKLIENTDKFITLKVKKGNKPVLYLFSGKHFDEFHKISTNMHFWEFRRNVEKYMKSVPKVMKVQKAEKKFL